MESYINKCICLYNLLIVKGTWKKGQLLKGSMVEKRSRTTDLDEPWHCYEKAHPLLFSEVPVWKPCAHTFEVRLRAAMYCWSPLDLIRQEKQILRTTSNPLTKRPCLLHMRCIYIFNINKKSFMIPALEGREWSAALISLYLHFHSEYCTDVESMAALRVNRFLAPCHWRRARSWTGRKYCSSRLHGDLAGDRTQDS